MKTRKKFWVRLVRGLVSPLSTLSAEQAVRLRRMVSALRRESARYAPANLAARLLDAAGVLPRMPVRSLRPSAALALEGLDPLEGRMLLAVDHPSFALPLTPTSGDAITLDVDGEGTATGTIETAGQDDLFRITAPSADLVRVLVDTPTGFLNSKVEIYDINGTLLRSSSNNGTLSSGITTDAWAGFIATAGANYFIRVLGESLGTTGAYTVRVDATSVDVPLITDELQPLLGQPVSLLNLPPDPVTGTVEFAQDDEVFKVTAGSSSLWHSLAFAVAGATDFDELDTHLEIYDAAGTELSSDTQAGRLTDAFSTWTSDPGDVFYIRVRADELGDPATSKSAGDFTLNVDLVATVADVSIVTRLGPADLGGALGSGQEANSFTFVAQGSGLSFVTVIGVPFPPLPDPSVRIYSEAGEQIGFSDDFNGNSAQLEIQLVGGQKYYLIVEGFDRAAGGNYAVFIEAHHTFVPTMPEDDHINGPPAAGLNLLATPLIFNAPFLNQDDDGNDIRDRSWRQTAVATGRMHAAGDTDLFMFTPPIDMLSVYDGDDGDEGQALFLGGRFTLPDGLVHAENLAVWDASDYWPAGPGTVDPLLGFDGEIRAVQAWDFDGGGANRPALVVGGDFTMEAAQGGPAVNFAIYAYNAQQNRYLWFALANTDEPINAFTIADPEAMGLDAGETDLPGALVLGGEFTDVGGVAAGHLMMLGFNPDPFNQGFYLFDFNGGVNNKVNALATWDPEDLEDPDDDGPLPDPPDEVEQLIVGGTFLQAGTGAGLVSVNRVGMFGVINDGDDTTIDPAGWRRLGVGPTNGINNGEVFAITSIDPADPDADTPAISRVVIAGDFTQAGGAAASNIATFLNDSGAASAPNALNGEWEELDGGVNDTVFALTIWFAPDAAGDTGDTPFLVAGGAFTDAGNRVAAHGISFGGWLAMDAGFDDGEVRALTAFEDDEFGTSTFEVVYAGGSFTAANGVETQHIAKFDIDPNTGLLAWLPLNNGLPDPTDIVLALDGFDDGLAGRWDRNERPAGRLGIVLSPGGGSFANMFVTVYDSNFNVIYTNETIAPPFPDPAGSVDPPSSDGTVDGVLIGVPLWGGEVYYIEVSGGSTGRYTLSVTIDALPPDDANALPPGTPGDGEFQDVISVINETPDAGEWGNAPEINVDAGNGDARNQVNAASLTPNTYASAYDDRTYEIDPAGLIRLHAGDFATIDNVNDTDLYAFTATRTGYVEIRVNTTNIADEFAEFIVDVTTGLVVGGVARARNNPADPANAPYQSLLDSALRIFNNDFEQISYNDDFPGVDGLTDFTFTGSFGGRTYQRRDARVVFAVKEGETYFVQVESGQAQRIDNTDPLNPDLSFVDWRFATGSYELLIHGMSSLNFIDDHVNSSVGAGQETPIPIVNDPADPANGTGSATGIIADHVLFNPNDDDVFDYIAPSRGTVSITVAADPGSSVAPIVRIENINGDIVGSGNGAAGGSITVNIPVNQGDRLFITVDGGGGSQGAYTVSIDGPGFEDDFASVGNWPNATAIVPSTYFGTAIIEGLVENPADSDIFVFTATAYEFATVTVEALDTTFDPFVQVYEIGEDGAAHPLFLEIAFNDDVTPETTTASATFSVTPTRPYYMVVSGFNQNLNFGGYRLTLRIAPTDDHPNFGELPPTIVPIVFDASNQTGTGSVTGVIEVDTDDDLFRFTAPASGDVNITLATPDSGLAPRITLLASDNTVIATDEGDNGGARIFATGVLVAGQQYFIVVEDGTSDDGNEPDFTGSYTLTINTAPVDDHPDEADFPTATTITLSAATGIGTATGFIVPFDDNDLFTFTTRAAGNVVISLSTNGSTLNPQIRVFDSTFTLIPGAIDDADIASQSFAATAAGQVFYIVVETDGAGSDRTGAYSLQVSGQTSGGNGGGGGPDDFPDAGEFGIASPLTLDVNTGDGELNGVIEAIGDSDLFQFVAPAGGNVYIQVVTPSGSSLDAGLRIFNATFTQIASNNAGLPGSTAALGFSATSGQTYYVLVSQIGTAVGSYKLRYDTTPATHYLYYPEGYSASTIDEFVPLVNTNSFAVTYTVIAHYENPGLAPTVIQSSVTIPANSRGGFTVSSHSNPTVSPIVRDTPYALEIRSTGQLGASLSHYDFGQTTGESFTGRTSRTWTFPEAHNLPAEYRDFLVFYNTGTSAANYTVDLFYDDGTVTTFSASLGGERRGGVNFSNDTRVPRQGTFGIRLTSDQPLVAALTSYNIQDGYGVGVLGNADGGATEGVIPAISHGGSVNSAIQIFNATATTASVTLRVSYVNLDLPDLVQTISVGAGRRNTLTLTSLGVATDQIVGVRFTSTAAVTVGYVQEQNGDGDGSAAATDAALRFVFGDAFVNPAFAGSTYIEDLALYNPAGFNVNVTITFRFEDGSAPVSTVVSLGSDEFAFISIDQQAAILARPGPTAFSLQIDSASPIIASFTHYDLFLAGGWSALGAPIGLTNLLSTI